MPDLTTKTGDVKAIIRRLQDSFNETLEVLYDLPQDYLQQPCGHGCARGGTARDLLIHNIFHEKQHTGQVWSVRDQLQLLPGWGNQDLPALLADYYTSRAQLIAALFGLADDQLDTKPKDGGWTIRETVEHVLHCDRDSIAALQLPSGMILWFPGGHADPWNHVEAAMALSVGGRVAEAEFRQTAGAVASAPRRSC